MPAAQGPIHVRTPRRTTRRTTRKPPAAIFGPVGRADAGITRAQRVAHQRTQRAQRKVERRVVVPYTPKLAHPTPAQRGAAQSIVARGLHRQGITTPTQVNALPRAQRQRVSRAKGYSRTARKYSQAQRALAAQPSLAQQARALGLASIAGLSPAAQSRALALRGIQQVTDARHPLAALNRSARTLGLRSIQNATLTGRADLLGRRGLQGALGRRYWQNLAAEGERQRTERGDMVAPGHHARLQLAGVGPSLDLTTLRHSLAGATTLGRGDLGPREILKNFASDAGALGLRRSSARTSSGRPRSRG
jgi:predicted flap endonuclease-1-like 5' DNA nuclease